MTTTPEGGPQGTGPADEPVLLERDGAVATITLNRPTAMNALDVSVKELLGSAVIEVAEDPSVRCVVLTGAGRAFCVGQDLKEHVRDLRGADPVPLSATVLEHYNPIVLALATMAKPVVAAVNGIAAGAGASLAFAADVRILGAGAGFNTAFAGIALSCDTGTSWTLPRLVGRSRALDLLYFPRTVGAAEALALGLASQVVPDEEVRSSAHELATRLANGPTLAFASIRRSVAHAGASSLESSLAFEADQMALTGASADHRAAVDAFLAKTTPEFEGR